MNVCRTCLTVAVAKDISLLPDELEGEPKTSSDIMLYCLGIQVVPESKLTTKLCIECFFNILSFHKFKTQAIKSDEYLQSLQEQVKDEVSIDDDIKKEDEIDIFDNDDIPHIALFGRRYDKDVTSSNSFVTVTKHGDCVGFGL